MEGLAKYSYATKGTYTGFLGKDEVKYLKSVGYKIGTSKFDPYFYVSWDK